MTERHQCIRLILLAETGAAPALCWVASTSRPGDSAALRLCLDRLVAPLKARDEPVRLRAGDTLAEQGRTILNAMAEGVITPHEAAPMMQAIGAQARIVEVDTLAQRLEVLEEAILRRR